jgi:hypothetical protein
MGKLFKEISFYFRNRKILSDFKKMLKFMANNNYDLHVVACSSIPDENNKGVGRIFADYDGLVYYKNELKNTIEKLSKEHQNSSYFFFPYLTSLMDCLKLSIHDIVDGAIEVYNLSNDEQKRLQEKINNEINKRINDFYNSFEDNFFESIFDSKN